MKNPYQQIMAAVVSVILVLLSTACRSEPAAQESPAAAAVTVEFVAHACFRLTSPAGASVMIDPYESQWWLGYDFPSGLDPTDAVLITHPHSDHDGGLAAGRDVPWTANTKVFSDAGAYRVGDITVTGIPGKHADPYGKEFGQKNTLWLLEIAGLRILHVGDNGPLTDAIVEQVGRVDVLMLPVDSEFHILTQAEIDAFRDRLVPVILIPMHYRHADLETDPDSPSDLGEIDEWLHGQDAVRRLGTHTWTVAHDELPKTPQVLVFEHSPRVAGSSIP